MGKAETHQGSLPRFLAETQLRPMERLWDPVS